MKYRFKVTNKSGSFTSTGICTGNELIDKLIAYRYMNSSSDRYNIELEGYSIEVEKESPLITYKVLDKSGNVDFQKSIFGRR